MRRCNLACTGLLPTVHANLHPHVLGILPDMQVRAGRIRLVEHAPDIFFGRVTFDIHDTAHLAVAGMDTVEAECRPSIIVGLHFDFEGAELNSAPRGPHGVTDGQATAKRSTPENAGVRSLITAAGFL